MSESPAVTTKLFHEIKKKVGKAVADFNLIENSDRILVALSGGKDSYALLHLLEALRRKAPINYQLIAVNVDPGFPGYDIKRMERYLLDLGFEVHLERTDSAAIIKENLRPGSSYCAFCARLRRGYLYSLADRLECNKIALGHHLDDFIETLLLNQFFIGRLAAMSANMLADNQRHRVIRPLVYVEESAIEELSRQMKFPLVHCRCPGYGGSDSKRKRIKQLIKELAEEIPDIRGSMIRALGHIEPRHLLDQTLMTSIQPQRQPEAPESRA